MGFTKSTVAKTAVTAGVALGVLGIGTGAANADPHPDINNPGQSQNHDQRDDRGGDRQQDNRDNDRPDREQHRNNGFWFFDRWVPLPW
ncbi:hypothetical protein ACWDOP_36045 [Nocardia sp. NPDC003693]